MSYQPTNKTHIPTNYRNGFRLMTNGRNKINRINLLHNTYYLFNIIILLLGTGNSKY